jgi:hypothetical protein
MVIASPRLLVLWEQAPQKIRRFQMAGSETYGTLSRLIWRFAFHFALEAFHGFQAKPVTFPMDCLVARFFFRILAFCPQVRGEDEADGCHMGRFSRALLYRFPFVAK